MSVLLAAELRGILRLHAASADVRERTDPVARRLDRLATVCLECDELELGIVVLIAAKLRQAGDRETALRVLLEDPQICRALIGAKTSIDLLRAGQGGL